MLGVHGRRAEVVREAQRVADLVHRRGLELGLDERFCLRAVERHFAARFQERHREGLVLGRLDGVRAIRRIAEEQWRASGRSGMLSAPRLLKARKLVASMPMSASRISPERGSTTVGPMAANPLRARRHPADRGMADVRGVELRVVGLDLDPDRVLVADALERLVPFEHAVADRRGRPSMRTRGQYSSLPRMSIVYTVGLLCERHQEKGN